jgi:hypothetical protein
LLGRKDPACSHGAAATSWTFAALYIGRCALHAPTVPIHDFSDLVREASRMPVAQRMLFVFMKTRAQKDYDDSQRSAFERGEGGAFQPMFCVDFAPEEVADLQALCTKADEFSGDWDKILVACMDAPSDGTQKPEVDAALKQLVARVETGADLSGFLCFERDGTPLTFT